MQHLPALACRHELLTQACLPVLSAWSAVVVGAGSTTATCAATARLGQPLLSLVWLRFLHDHQKPIMHGQCRNGQLYAVALAMQGGSTS